MKKDFDGETAGHGGWGQLYSNTPPDEAQAA
jgi:hypothetical protein